MEIWNGEIMPIDLLKHGENKIGMKRKFNWRRENENVLYMWKESRYTRIRMEK